MTALLAIAAILLVIAVSIGVVLGLDATARARHWRIGRWSWILPMGHGGCRRCETTWRYVDPHVLAYAPATLGPTGDVVNGRGVMALCEVCSRELGTPEARYPYYQEVVSEWTDVYRSAGRPEQVERIQREIPSIVAALQVDR